MSSPTEAPFFIVTRCGVRLDEHEVSEDFLRSRAELFNKYFVPSVNQQTDRDFTVALCFDAAIVESVIQAFVRDLTVPFEVIRTAHPWLESVNERFQGYGSLVTATCDSDDALAPDFVGTARRLVRSDRGLCFRQVVRYSPESGGFEMKPKPSNPFVVRHSSSGEWVLSHDGVHGTFASVVDVDDVWWPPMGLQVVHGLNLENQMFRIVPPLSPEFAVERFQLDFPRLRTSEEHRSDYLRYLARPRLLGRFVRKKGPIQVLRTFLHF